MPILTAPPPKAPLPDMPIEPTWIKEGKPTARGVILMQSADRKVASGQWSCEPGKFEWTFSWDEFVHVFEGEVDITDLDTGKTVTLRGGDMAHFSLGMKTLWHVRKKVRKFFVIRTPQPL